MLLNASDCLSRITNGAMKKFLLSRREIADYINQAFETSDIVGICEAISAATHLHNISDIAKKSGIERPSVYRAFSGSKG
jgi:probable addiction module antidote protein